SSLDIPDLHPFPTRRSSDLWTVAGCLRKIRAQAENVTRVHSIYVVNKKEKLIGRLSLRDLITAKSDQKIGDIYIKNVDYVFVDEDRKSTRLNSSHVKISYAV